MGQSSDLGFSSSLAETCGSTVSAEVLMGVSAPPEPPEPGLTDPARLAQVRH